MPLAASAQQNVAANSVEQVVVSGSRVIENGAQAPTPVTVMAADQLQLSSPISITTALVQMPILNGSTSILNQSTGTTSSNGADYLNLRRLGTSRTLVLLDGHRMVPASSAGSVDVAQVPEALVQRVDIVTGGASAAYGSDAVAGVVNYILDTKFEGLKADAAMGISNYGDDDTYKFSVTAGTSYLGGRLHVEGSFMDSKTDGVTVAQSRPWINQGRGTITNPNATAATATPSNPVSVVVTNPQASNAARGGLITNTLLKGTTFDPGGAARAYQYGTLVTSTTQAGGEGWNPNNLLTLQPSQRRDQIFTHITYDLTDSLSVYLEAMGSQNHIKYNSLPTFETSQTAFTMFSGNPYLPASVQSIMTAKSIPSFTMGRISADIAIPNMDAITNSGTVTIGFDGKFPGSSWTYSGYGQMGRDFDSYKTHDDPISDNLYNAADAVINPANGQIVCRTTLTNPTNGCVPVNLFGDGSPSPTALAYINGTAIERVSVAENVAEVSATGDVFDLPAGAASLAVGAAYRTEAFNQTSDPQSQEIRSGINSYGDVIRGFPTGLVNTLGGYERTNPQPASGRYNVWEAFAETEIPLLKNAPLANSLTLNAAGRYVHYSLSGGVEPWKLGLVYEPLDWVRFRASRSTDIRAPALGELYQGSSQGTSTVQDAQNGNQTVNVISGAIGNADLKPEIAHTTTVGTVLTPDFIPGLTFSTDYFWITITNAISALPAQTEMDFCSGGSASICKFIIRSPDGTLSRIELPYFNVASFATKGADIEADYNIDLSEISSDWSGSLRFRNIANYTAQFTQTVQGSAPRQSAGNYSTPDWQDLASVNLDMNDWHYFVQERIIGGGKIDRTKGPSELQPNEVPAVFYTDATISYDFSPEISGFFTVGNVFNRAPEQTPSYLITGSNFGNRQLYDMIGRVYTVGIHYRQ